MPSKIQRMTLTFGMNVRSTRLLRNLSQESLAQQTGIYRTYLSRIESGLANPSLLVIAALANALQVAPGELLMATSAEPEPEPVDPPAA